MKDFKKLEIWQLGMEIADQVFDLFDTIPWQQAGHKIRDQATDAACSIPVQCCGGEFTPEREGEVPLLRVRVGFGL